MYKVEFTVGDVAYDITIPNNPILQKAIYGESNQPLTTYSAYFFILERNINDVLRNANNTFTKVDIDNLELVHSVLSQLDRQKLLNGVEIKVTGC